MSEPNIPVEPNQLTEATQPTELLLSLATDSHTPLPGKKDFRASMQALKLYSVVDIAHLTKTEFIKMMAVHSDEDSGRIHDQAVSYSAQLEFVHRGQRHLMTEEERAKREASAQQQNTATYTRLFPENPERSCPAESLAAIDSPAAYLRALCLFARDVEKTGEGTNKKNTLDARRPSIKNMLIDSRAVYEQIPILSIVNETLSEHIKVYLDNKNNGYAKKNVSEILSEKCFPLQLPFYLAHQQCLLGLAGEKPALGELNYKISLTLPFSEEASTAFGKVQQESYKAQHLLSGLSPPQQALITAEKPFDTEEKHKDDFAKKHLGSDFKSLIELPHFMQKTELDAEQLQELFSVGKYQPWLSANVRLRDTLASSDIDTALKKQDAVTELGLSNIAQLDRLQRTIRLQRWSNMSFTDLKIFLHSVEQAATHSANFIINDNTLRALGVYRYLSKRYVIQPEEFSSLLHLLPVHAVGGRPALYDRIFNQAQLFKTPLELDDTALELVNPQAASQSTLNQICANLPLTNTPDSFGLLCIQTNRYGGAAKKNQITLTCFYRQVRIANLFGISVMESLQLAELLGAKEFCKQLVLPTLRPTDVNASADFLDMLMQMDWAIQWFKDCATTLQKIRRQLILENAQCSPSIKQDLNQLDQAFTQLKNHLLPEEEIGSFSPELEEIFKKCPFSRNKLLARSILKAFPLLPEKVDLEKIHTLLESDIKKSLKLSDDPEGTKTLENAANALKPFLKAAHTRLLPWKEQIKSLFKVSTPTRELLPLSEKMHKYVVHNMATTLGYETAGNWLKHSLLVMPHSANHLELPVTEQVLHTFLMNPHWLDNKNKPGSRLRLAFSTLYFFHQFQHFKQRYRSTESDLLNYLSLANSPGAAAEPELTEHLSRLLDWSADEIKALLKHTPNRRFQSIAQLDWLMRCHRTSELTGLSTSCLLAATDLNPHIPGPEWTRVAEAVMAAHNE